MVTSGEYTTLFRSTQIDVAQHNLAKQINSYHKEYPLPTTAVCVLNGGFMFYSHVLKFLAFDLKTDFCKATSYHGRMQASKVHVQRFTDQDGDELFLEPDQRIYIFDDILDTGNTAIALAEYYQYNFRPAELILATVAHRKSAPTERLLEHYSQIMSLFEIDDEWLVGYGMDNEQGFMRQSPQILAKR